jgi:hypothetical protein
MLTILGGNVHFGSPGQYIGISYTNRLYSESYWSAGTGYIQGELDTMGSITWPSVPGGGSADPVKSITESIMYDDYKSIPDGIGGYNITRETIEYGIAIYQISPSLKVGDIQYIPYLVDSNTFPYTNYSSIQIRTTGFNQSEFVSDAGKSMSWMMGDRNDNIPTVDGYSGWDLNWNENTGKWQYIEIITGGGRYKETLIIVGQTSNGNGCIYYSV